MTMIACTIKNNYPILIGDVLLSGEERPAHFYIPASTGNVMDHLSEDAELFPLELRQKICILTDRICFAYSGYSYYAQQFLGDLRSHLQLFDKPTMEDIQRFMKGHGMEDYINKLSFLVVVIVEVLGSNTQSYSELGFGGTWESWGVNVIGDVHATGSGAMDFLSFASNVNAQLSTASETPRQAVMTNLSVIASLLAKEHMDMKSLKNHWGAALELVCFDDGRFIRFDNVSYILYYVPIQSDGSLGEPIESKITHYRYEDGHLIVLDMQPTEISKYDYGDKVDVTFKNVNAGIFVIPEIDYDGAIDIEHYKLKSSFKTTRIGIGYVFQGEGRTFYPGSFHLDDGIEVSYSYEKELRITLPKYIEERARDMWNRKRQAE